MKSLTLRVWVIAAVLAVISVAAKGDPVTISTADGDGADTYLSANDATYGDYQYITLTGDDVRQGLMRFDLTAWKAAGGSAASVKLRIYHGSLGDGATTRTLTIKALIDGSDQEGRPADGGWVESSITGNTAPTDYWTLGAVDYLSGDYGWKEFSSAMLNRFVSNDTNGVVTLRISINGASNDRFWAKEYSSGAFAPELVIEPATNVTISTADGDGADTYLYANDATYGDYGYMTTTDPDVRQGLMRFDLTAWKAVGVSDASVKLRVYHSDFGEGETNTLTIKALTDGSDQEGRPADGGWVESSITGNTAPTDYSGLGSIDFIGADFGWKEFSSAALDRFVSNDTNGVVTLRISTISTTANLSHRWSTKEASYALAPELVIEPVTNVTISTADGDGADTYLSANDATYGDKEYITTTAPDSRQALMRFDLSAFKATGCPVESATLLVYYYFDYATGGFTNTLTIKALTDGSDQEGRPTDGGWVELSITGNNAPTSYSTLGSIDFITGAYGWKAFSSATLDDLISHDGNGVVTLSLSTSAGSSQRWYPKEYSSAAFAPELVIRLGIPKGTMILLR